MGLETLIFLDHQIMQTSIPEISAIHAAVVFLL